MKTELSANNPSLGESWKSVRKRLFTPEENAESDLRVEALEKTLALDPIKEKPEQKPTTKSP